MKVVLEIENDQELDKIMRVLRDNQFQVKTTSELRLQRLNSLFSKCEICLPQGFKFKREEIYDRKTVS
jgi:hypothetical protein